MAEVQADEKIFSASVGYDYTGYWDYYGGLQISNGYGFYSTEWALGVEDDDEDESYEKQFEYSLI